MSEAAFLLSLYAAAVIVLLLEIFIPSHGVLTVVGVGLLIAAVARTFDAYGTTAGVAATIGSMIALPVFAVVTVKVWPHTRVGKVIAPPNPVYEPDDFSPELAAMRELIGTTGRSVSPLRPVGTCEFAGRRVQCICESGLVEAGVTVRAIGLRGHNLEVAMVHDETKTA